MSYFKKEDVGEGLVFKYLGGSVKTKKKKDGSSYEIYEMMVEFQDGTTDTRDIFLKSAEFGGIYNPENGESIASGRQVQAYVNGDFVNYKVLPEGEAVLQEPQPSNYQQNKQTKVVKENMNAEEEKWHAIAVSKIIHNFMRDFITQGSTSKEAADKSVIAYTDQYKAVDEILKMESQDGITTNPSDSQDNNELPF